MDEKLDRDSTPRLSRRKFIGALGAAAGAGAYLQRGVPAQASVEQVYYYQNSFGSIAPAGLGAIELGVYPPPVMSAGLPDGVANDETCTNLSPDGTYYSCGYPLYNILLVMVDQMRNPGFWLPSGGIDGVIPRISELANSSFSFPNYWVAATVCGPSRACLLTGLYSQQTCIFNSAPYGLPIINGNHPTPPPLLPYNTNWTYTVGNNINPGFPTIGNVLSQSLFNAAGIGQNAYDCTWIGKWHLSCQTGTPDGSPGNGGPRDYGFSDVYSLPNLASPDNPYPANTSYGYPSPNGFENQGTGGDFLDSYLTAADAPDVPSWGSSVKNNSTHYIVPELGLSQLNDAAIASAFLQWLNQQANVNLNGGNASDGTLYTPWFCAVSFVNPHDIADFPYSFGLTPTADFSFPSSPAANGYQPPPFSASGVNYSGSNCLGNNCPVNSDIVTIPAFNNTGPYTALPSGSGSSGPWNWEDLPSLPYASGTGKPDLQLYFLYERNNICGNIQTPTYSGSDTWTDATGWITFLNYYMWMQSCVDYQVGRVLGTTPSAANTGLKQSSFWGNTVIIFTSDHGDYGGSHGIHSKGGALYEEVMNVPLYISYPSMRSAYGSGQPVLLPFTCSSVDLLPFIYTLALGNHSWRLNPSDIVYYLQNREAITDAIYAYNNASGYTGVLPQHRLSGIRLHQTQGNGTLGFEVYQPFVLHTTDDYSPANVSGGWQPSHAIAYRTVDQTDVNSSSAPFYPQNSYGGGKLGIYSFWDTCDTSEAPIMPNNNATNQYEFYNYSVHPTAGNIGNNVANPQEVGNQYNSNAHSQAAAYQTDFYGNAVQTELYELNLGTGAGNSTLQVQAAIQVAYQNYLLWLECMNTMTGSNGVPGANCVSGFSCPPQYEF